MTFSPKEQSKRDRQSYRDHVRAVNTPERRARRAEARADDSRYDSERLFIDKCERRGVIVRPLPEWY
jgi:hypothetical protein